MPVSVHLTYLLHLPNFFSPHWLNNEGLFNYSGMTGVVPESPIQAHGPENCSLGHELGAEVSPATPERRE